MSCVLSCGVRPYEVYDATVHDYHERPMPLMRVSIPGVGVRNIWYSPDQDNPLPVGAPIKVRYTDRHGWSLEEECED